MVKYTFLILFSVLFAALLLVVFTHECQPPTGKDQQPKPNQWISIPPVTNTTDTVLKTVYVPVVQKQPSDTVFIGTDTAQIIKSFFTQKLYKQLYSDPYLDIEVTDSIAENSLMAQSVRYTPKTTSLAPLIQVWAGVTADTRKRIAFNLFLKDKKDYLYTLGYSTDKAFLVSVAIPIIKKQASN